MQEPGNHSYTDNEAELKQALVEIIKWEEDQKDLWFWEKLGRLPFAILDKLTPKALQNKFGQVIDEIGSYVQTGGRYLISEKSVLDSLSKSKFQDRKRLSPSEQLTLEQVPALPLAIMNEVAGSLGESRKKLAFYQGASTGFGGIFTLAIDIPAILGLSLKVLQEIAICYGFNPNDPAERVFIVKCLQFSSSDIVGKKAILDDLTDFDKEIQHKQVISQIQGWRETVLTYVDNFGWKKLFQMIPIAGMVFGAFINKSTIEDVAEVGRMLYRKRRIMLKLQEMNQNKVS